MRKERNFGIVIFLSLKPVQFSKGIGHFSTTCKISACCINKFTQMPPVELIHIFDSHSSLFPLGFTYSFVVMAFNSFLKHFASTISAAGK